MTYRVMDRVDDLNPSRRLHVLTGYNPRLPGRRALTRGLSDQGMHRESLLVPEE